MNTKRNLRRKKRTDAVFVSDATWNSCQHGERDTQHVSDVTRHNMSRARDMPPPHWSRRLSTAFWLVRLCMSGILLSIKASLVIASRRGIKTLISKLDLVIERSLTVKVDSRCFHLEKVALRKGGHDWQLFFVHRQNIGALSLLQEDGQSRVLLGIGSSKW